MKFWDGYWKSLKPLEVEEPIDVWVHRPLAYLLARAVYRLPVSPNAITMASIAVGVFSGYAMISPFPNHLVVAGAALFSSAVLDCADGQLARLRGTSSDFGRMLDGFADLVVSVAAVGGGAYLVWRGHAEPVWEGVLALALASITILTGSFHTSSYDHYKNVFLRMTHPTYREGEDYEQARVRYEQARPRTSLLLRAVWSTYLFYVRSQSEYVERFDPHAAKLSKLPGYDPERARIYREHAGGLMRLWRSLFGFGSLVFGMSVTIALGVVDYYLLFRLLVLNLIFYGYLRPRQRRASEAAFRGMGLAA
jgi:phosphatidylglycerophosphate synthase